MTFVSSLFKSIPPASLMALHVIRDVCTLFALKHTHTHTQTHIHTHTHTCTSALIEICLSLFLSLSPSILEVSRSPTILSLALSLSPSVTVEAARCPLELGSLVTVWVGHHPVSVWLGKDDLMVNLWLSVCVCVCVHARICDMASIVPNSIVCAAVSTWH